MTLLARAKGKTLLPAATRPVHTARRAGQRTKTANSTFQQDLIRHGHGARYGTRVQSIRYTCSR